jgi:PAS domain S-box-containing protein
MSAKQDKAGNKGIIVGDRHDEARARDKDKLIDELRGRVEFLEKELQARLEELHAMTAEHERRSQEFIRDKEALRESEERLRLAQRSAKVGVWDWNPRTGEDHFTPELSQIYGLAPGTIKTYQDWRRLVHPGDIVRVEAERDKAIANHEAFNLVMRIFHSSGEVRWINASGGAIYDEDGSVSRVLGVVRDITERRQAEETLRMSEASLAMAQEIAHLANWEVDVKTNRVRGSKELYRMFNMKPDAPLDAYVGKYHPEDRARVVEAIEASIYGGKPYNIDYCIVPQPGVIRHIHGEGGVTYDDNGHPVTFFGTVQDVTERKQAEEKLHDNYRFTSVLIGNLPGMVFRCRSDEDWTMEFVSRGCQKLTGYRVEDLFNNSKISYAQLIHPGDRGRVRNEMQEAFRDKKPFISSYRIISASGEEKWVWTQGRNLFSKGREIIEGYAFDITDTKRAGEALKEAKQQSELYLDLMGHDIRNMNMIGMGFLELALESPDIKKEDKELLLKSLGSLENSTHLIDNVRKLQKARSGEMKHHMVDACHTFMRVLARFSNMPGVNASFNLDIPSSCPVNADDLLYEVFENLVGNAIKHGGPEPVIDIRYDMVEMDDGRYYRFIVEDNGPGIPDATKERIFNRLQRGNTTAKGIGLGLYLVKSLVESYQGKVWAEDRVKGDHTKGARFVVMLPAVESENR